ncbi:KH domain-containing protein [Euphorbia peplus]|nr:KH domain-containing protein [Euphorbia peplus]
MGEPELEGGDNKDFADGGKRKLEGFELAKQKVLEIANRITNDAEAKRPKLEHTTPSFPVPFIPQSTQYLGSQGINKRITIPNGKVGVVIGKGGETIKQIQQQSGAKVQITKDQVADPHALTRDVELIGSSEQISRAEELINDVISEADAGSSASSAVHGLNVKQYGGEQFAVKVPNDKVGLLIGKGGETIKYMQNKSGARMQIIPLHLPPGDPSTERTVYISGSTEQIEAAKELVNDVVSGKRIIDPSGTSAYAQPAYASAGNWAQQAQPPVQQYPQYGYAQSGNQPAAASYYGNYGQQVSWDPSNQSTMYQTPQMTGYGYYGQPPQMGSAPFDPTYGYSQQTPNYAENIPTQTEQQKPYAQADGTIPSQSNETASGYAPSTYGQSYWTGQQQPQTGYDVAAYGGQPPAQVPHSAIYGQAEYPPQPSSAPATYPPAYGQSPVEAQPSNNGHAGHSQSLGYGAESHDGNLNPGHDAKPTEQEDKVEPEES